MIINKVVKLFQSTMIADRKHQSLKHASPDLIYIYENSLLVGLKSFYLFPSLDPFCFYLQLLAWQLAISSLPLLILTYRSDICL
jgi:hypothetical protein